MRVHVDNSTKIVLYRFKVFWWNEGLLSLVQAVKDRDFSSVDDAVTELVRLNLTGDFVILPYISVN